MKEKIESMTMEEIKKALEVAVESYNGTKDAYERTKLEKECKDYVAKYNELAVLTDYAKILANTGENPIVAIAKAYKYDIIAVKFNVVEDVVDGKSVTVKVASVDETGKKTHNLIEFIEWAEKHNKKIAYATDWKAKMEDARTAINKDFQKVMESEDGYKTSKNVIKAAMQSLFDSMVFMPGESGKNAIYPTKDGVNIIVAIAADLKEAIDSGEVAFTLQFLGKQKWRSLIFKVLHLSVKGKKIAYLYGDPEEKPKVKKSKAKPETETEAKA